MTMPGTVQVAGAPDQLIQVQVVDAPATQFRFLTWARLAASTVQPNVLVHFNPCIIFV